MEQVDSLKNINILYAEDEPEVLEMVLFYLSRRVKSVYGAADGEEALKIFEKEKIDILITDITMPKLNGLSLISKIREVNSEIPIIVISAYYDSEFLLQAIDLDVTSFLTKPFHKSRFDKSLNKCYLQIERYKLKQELEIAKQKELELFEYKDKYHTWQEENAFKKQQKLIKDELYCKYQDGIFFSSKYEPLDVLSGDSYGTVEIGSGKYLLFLFDATGKGLSASVTSILLTAYINNSIEVAKQKNDYDFKKLIDYFLIFIKKQLLTDEILGALFFELNTEDRVMSYSSFGMPPIFCEEGDRKVYELDSNNPPVSPYTKGFKVSSRAFNDIRKLLLVSDGVIEAPLKSEEGVYYRKIVNDFRESVSVDGFFHSFDMAVGKKVDDISAIYLFFEEVDSLEKKGFTIKSKLSDIDSAVMQIEHLLEGSVDDTKLESFKGAVFEVLVNSLEHGSYGIDYNEKKRLIASKEYDKIITARQNISYFYSKEIRCDIFCSKSSLKKCFGVIISDSGEGFDVSGILKESKIKNQTLFSGRGIKMAQIYSDGLFYSKKGDTAYLLISE